jgi:hypothetical protein
MVVYFELMGGCGSENAGKMFLWLAVNIKMSVTASYIVGKCRTDTFVSVFCDAKESMEFLSNEEWLHNSAVSLLGTWNTSFYPYWRAKSVIKHCLELLFCTPEPVHIFSIQNKGRASLSDVSRTNYIFIRFFSYLYHFMAIWVSKRICLLNTILQYFVKCEWVYVSKYVSKPYIFHQQYKITFKVLYLYAINDNVTKCCIFCIYYYHLQHYLDFCEFPSFHYFFVLFGILARFECSNFAFFFNINFVPIIVN